jgi:P-aminobenzoate N-oxygenase AurF
MTTIVPAHPPGNTAGFETKIQRLNRLSAGRGTDAYTDIAWSDPTMTVELPDLRLRLPALEPLTDTDWYRSLTAEQQAVVGAWPVASYLKLGWHFENVLQQALLHRALYLDPGSPEFRYLHHEVIEESQHTLMFNELVGRIGVAPQGMPWWLRRFNELVLPTLAKHFPAAFFVAALTGEDPIDWLQRRWLAGGVPHPLVELVMRVHVAEETRHVSFARLSIQRDMPTDPIRRHVLAIMAPLAFGYIARLMLIPPADMRRAVGLPRRTARAAYRSDKGRRFLADAVAKPRQMVSDLGLMTGPAKVLWRAVGLWDDDTQPQPKSPTPDETQRSGRRS